MSEPTGGNWVVADKAYNPHWRGDGTEVLSEFGRIADTSVNGLRPLDECRANARLIAAAPAMLDALATVYRALMSDPPHGPQKHVGPDDVIYCLDGQLMYHAINAARDALALVRASMRESSADRSKPR